MNKVGAITQEMQEGGSEGGVRDIHGTVPNATELNRLVGSEMCIRDSQALARDGMLVEVEAIAVVE